MINRILILGLVSLVLGCSTTPKEVEAPRNEAKPNVDMLDCQKKFGLSANASVVSETECICRHETEDVNGDFTKVYNKWKMKLWQDEKKGTAKVAKTREAWRNSVRQEFSKVCPEGLDPNLIPVEGRIICESPKFLKGHLSSN